MHAGRDRVPIAGIAAMGAAAPQGFNCQDRGGAPLCVYTEGRVGSVAVRVNPNAGPALRVI